MLLYIYMLFYTACALFIQQTFVRALRPYSLILLTKRAKYIAEILPHCCTPQSTLMDVIVHKKKKKYNI